MNKQKKAKELSINTLLFAVSSFGTKCISFLLVPLYTYVLSTSDYGSLDLITTTVQLLVPILTLNISDAILRFALDRKCDPEEVISVGLRISGISSLILALGMLLVMQIPAITIDASYLLYLYVLYIVNALNGQFSMYLKAVNKVKLLAVCGIVNTLVTCLLNLLLLLVWKLGVTGYMIANISGSLLSILIMFAGGRIFRAIGKKGTLALFREMSLFSLPLVVNSLAWWVNNVSDRYILTFFCGTSANGIYSVSYKIPTILSTIQGVFYNAWSISAITEFDKDDKDGFLGNVYTAYSTVSMLACSCIMVCNIYLAHILYSKDFLIAWKYVPPLLLGMVFNGISTFEGCLFSAVKRTKDVSVTTIAGAGINTILNFVLIPVMGAMGAAISTLFGYFFVWITRTLQLRNIITLHVNWKKEIICIALVFMQCLFAIMFEKIYLQLPFLILILALNQQMLSKLIRVRRRKEAKHKDH